MEIQIIHSLTDNFEAFSHKTEEGIEFWLARDLQQLLGYTEWRNFTKVILKSKTACELSGQQIDNHFVDINKTIQMPTVTFSMNDKIYDKLMDFVDTLPKDSIAIYKMDINESDIIQIIGNKAVKEAQRKNLENDIPNVYSKNGVMYPFEKGELKERLDALTVGSEMKKEYDFNHSVQNPYTKKVEGCE